MNAAPPSPTAATSPPGQPHFLSHRSLPWRRSASFWIWAQIFARLLLGLVAQRGAGRLCRVVAGELALPLPLPDGDLDGADIGEVVAQLVRRRDDEAPCSA